MKKLINDPAHLVREMLEGFVDLAPDQAIMADEAIVLRRGLPEPSARGLAVLSGGGSGHEPAHAGYVGAGLLTAAVAGDVFTSPSVDGILAAIRAAAGPAGALLIVKNYTGDRLNFALAAEMAHKEGIPCEIAVVADDVALRDTVEPARRRGIAGTVLVHKVAGAAAASGRSLAETAALARAAAAELGTMGVALGPCTVPAAGRPGFTLGENEIELGLGIHGEKGVARGPLLPADALVERMLDTIITDRGFVPGDRLALLVNGLGGTPAMELAVVARHALARLRAGGFAVERAWCGTYLSALEMPGCSLSLMRLDDGRLSLLDQEAQAPAWTASGRIAPSRTVIASPPAPPADTAPLSAGPLTARLRAAGLAIAAALEQAEPSLTDLDAQAGDGDLGASMVRGAQAIRALPDSAWASPATLCFDLGNALRRAVAGSSGPFYAAALLRAARRLDGKPIPSPADWADAFAAAVAAISELGGAKPGDRTMIDALHPAADALLAGRGWAEAVRQAESGAAATAHMKPQLGRASYLGERALGTIDAGAAAVVTWMQAITIS